VVDRGAEKEKKSRSSFRVTALPVQRLTAGGRRRRVLRAGRARPLKRGPREARRAQPPALLGTERRVDMTRVDLGLTPRSRAGDSRRGFARARHGGLPPPAHPSPACAFASIHPEPLLESGTVLRAVWPSPPRHYGPRGGRRMNETRRSKSLASPESVCTSTPEESLLVGGPHPPGRPSRHRVDRWWNVGPPGPHPPIQLRGPISEVQGGAVEGACGRGGQARRISRQLRAFGASRFSWDAK